MTGDSGNKDDIVVMYGGTAGHTYIKRVTETHLVNVEQVSVSRWRSRCVLCAGKVVSECGGRLEAVSGGVAHLEYQHSTLVQHVTSRVD